MKSEIPAYRSHTASAHLPPVIRTCAMCPDATPHGARLARQHTVRRLADWGVPPGVELSDTAALLVSELATNAVQHATSGAASDVGTLQCRLELHPSLPHAENGRRPVLLRVEVSDSRADLCCEPLPTHPAAESGRGLCLVHALATRWGCEAHSTIGKTVWAELEAEIPAGNEEQ